MVDLLNVDTVNHKLNVIWTNFDSGALGTTAQNVQGGVNAINQAFLQSEYIKTN
jgi:hypothetical protein